MKKAALLILIPVICIGLIFILIRTADDEDQWDKKEKALHELKYKISSLWIKFPNDLEIQLGIAALYFNLDQCERVLSIDPNNKPGLALYSMRLCWEFVGRRTNEIKYLEGMIENARGRNAEEISISVNSSLRKYFSEEDKFVSGKRSVGRSRLNQAYYLLISDFDLAVRQLREKIDEEIPYVLAGINNAQNRDPNNAYYNYLKAHLYLTLNEKEKALKEIEEGVLKEYFSSFQEELARAKDKVLQETGLEKNLRDFICGSRSPFEYVIYSGIWKKGLSDLGKEYEARGEIDKAAMIYRLTIEMVKQVHKDFNKHSGRLDKEAQKRINELSDKTQP